MIPDVNDFDGPGFAEAIENVTDEVRRFSDAMRMVAVANNQFIRLVVKAMREAKIRRRCYWRCKKRERRKSGRRQVVLHKE